MIQKIDKTQIEAGISAIIDPEISIANNAGEVPNEFNGYISSFGAQVIQSGLAPAVVFFEDKDANSNEDRGKIIKAIMQIMGLTRGSMYNHIKNMNPSQMSETERAILEAAVALKLAIRTFKLKK